MKALAYTEIGTQPVVQFSVQQVLLALTLFYWNPVTGAWQSSVPTFARGLQGGVRFQVTNNTAYNRYIRGQTTIRRPDGTQFSLAGLDKLLLPGTSGNWDFLFTTDQAGTWQHNVAVYSGSSTDAMSLALTQGWTDAAFAQVAAAGTITKHDFWNPATSLWQSTAPTVLVGDTLILRGHARNDSGVQMRARMDARVTDPTGGVSTITGAVGTMEASGAAQQGTWTFSIPLNKAGAWTVGKILYGELV